jgi:predicted dehydrogenase
MSPPVVRADFLWLFVGSADTSIDRKQRTPMSSPTARNRINRRNFLRITSASTAALSAGTWLARGAATSANEKLSIGIIGAGGRGSDLMSQISAVADKQNVRITALCDVWQKNLKSAAARVKDRFGAEPRQCTRFGELLALKDIDAVVIATPDFGHAPILVAALQAGKDVYIEKPMSIDLALANQAFDVARRQERVVQVGTQYRSDGHYRGAVKLMASGILGKVSRISVAMDFNEARWARDVSDCLAPDVDWDAFLLDLRRRPFDPLLLRRWQLYRDCTNGLSGLWMSHYADLIHMLTGAQYPNSAVALGGIYVWKDGREHTDTFHAAFDYPEGFLFDWAMALGNSAGTHFTVHGTKGTMDLQNWTVSNAGSTDKEISTRPIPTESAPSHMENWIECIRSREKPSADIQYGHQHAVATIMAARALETGFRQRYDPATRTILPG